MLNIGALMVNASIWFKSTIGDRLDLNRVVCIDLNNGCMEMAWAVVTVWSDLRYRSTSQIRVRFGHDDNFGQIQHAQPCPVADLEGVQQAHTPLKICYPILYQNV